MTIRSLLSSTNRLRNRIRSRGSSPAVGSSTTSIRGKFNSIKAIPIRCFIPPEKEPILSFLRSYICTDFNTYSILSYRTSLLVNFLRIA